MANPFPANFEGLDGSRRLTGQVNFTDPANQPGSATIQTRAYYLGNAVTIANAATGTLTWDTKAVGDALLDISTPSQPTAVADGVYAFAVQVVPTQMTVGGTYSVSLDLDFNGDDPSVVVTSPAAVSALRSPIVSPALTYFVPAGGLMKLAVTNHDGVQSIDFSMSIGIVQRLS